VLASCACVRPLNFCVISPQPKIRIVGWLISWIDVCEGAPLFPRRVVGSGCPGSGLSPVIPSRLSLGMPPRTGRKPHHRVVDKVLTEQGTAIVPRWRGPGHLLRRQVIDASMNPPASHAGTLILLRRWGSGRMIGQCTLEPHPLFSRSLRCRIAPAIRTRLR
jgi:hypothetical protein